MSAELNRLIATGGYDPNTSISASMARGQEMQAQQQKNQLTGMALQQAQDDQQAQSQVEGAMAGQVDPASLSPKAQVVFKAKQLDQRVQQMDSDLKEKSYAGQLIQGVKDQNGYSQWRDHILQIHPDVKIPEQYDPAYVDQTKQQAVSVIQSNANELAQAKAERDTLFKSAQISALNQKTSDAKDKASTTKEGVDAWVEKVGNTQASLSEIPRGDRTAVIAKLAEKYPEFDSRQYDILKGFEKSAAFGNTSKNINSLNTLNQHLAVLSDIHKQMYSSGNKTASGLIQAIGREFNDPNVRSYNAAKQLVAGELTKIIAGIGTEEDRNRAQDALDGANSEESLAAAIDTIHNLADGRMASIRQQANSAGMSNAEFDKRFVHSYVKAAYENQPPLTVHPDLKARIDAMKAAKNGAQ